MDISYVKTNTNKLSHNDLIKMIIDLIIQNLNDVENYNVNRLYKIGDLVYLEQNGEHYVYECIVNNTMGEFNSNKWVPICKMYNGPTLTFNTIRIREEVYIPKSSVSSYTIKLDFDTNQTSVAVYRGMTRFARGYDFEINKKTITFTKPLEANKRIIIELRERLGIIANIIIGIVLYDKDDNPYNVIITDTGVVQVIRITQKDPIRDVKRARLIYGDSRYYLMVDNSKTKPVLGLFEDFRKYIQSRDGKVYSISISSDDTLNIKYEPDIEEGVKYIMGSDKMFYEFDITESSIYPIRKYDSALLVKNHNIGFTLKSDNYKDKMIDVVNGVMRIVDYLPNTPYNNIRLKSKLNSDVYNLNVDDNLMLYLSNTLDSNKTYSNIYDDLYFYNQDLDYWKLYIGDRNNLTYESCNEVVVRDSRGINLISAGGILCKFILHPNKEIEVIQFIDLSKRGTFSSPLEYGLAYSNTKMITVDSNNVGLSIGNKPSDITFIYKNHYILGSDNKIYQLVPNGSGVNIVECNESDFAVENKKQKMVVKNKEMINIVDINNNVVNIKPVSTITHRIKDMNGNKYLLDVAGNRGNETLSINIINSSHKYYDLGAGYLYIKNNNGDYYIGKIKNNSLIFEKTSYEKLILYNISSLIHSSKGWYNIELEGTDVKLEKIFNNIYNKALSYSISREFVMESENKIKFSLSANGNGDVVINKTSDINDKYLLLRSSDDNIYSLGVRDNQVVSYRSYMEKDVKIDKVVYIKDAVTRKYYMIYMNNDSLQIEPITTAPTNSKTEIFIYNNYDDEFILTMINGNLVLVKDIIDKITDINGNMYSISINNNELKFTSYTGTTNNLTIGPLKLHDMVTNVNYKCYVKGNDIELENTNEIFESPTQAIRTIDGNIYILSLFENKISLSMINSSSGMLRKSRSIRKNSNNIIIEDYIPMRLYNNIMNTKDSIIYNNNNIIFKDDILQLVDVDDTTSVYKI